MAWGSQPGFYMILLLLLLLLLLQQLIRFRVFVVPKNHQIGGVFTLETKKHCKYWCFSALEAQNHGIYDVFGLWLHKLRYLQCFFCQCLAKTLIFNAVSTMLQDVVSICEKDKNTVFYDLLFPGRSKKSSKNCSKTAQNQLSSSSSSSRRSSSSSKWVVVVVGVVVVNK